ncbi:hypothetical protein DSL72_006643 [Monilinia vaccinii-corymbosi]|uniref:Uncharacterized protein n=1 Tax=Monilinia vaccinii-corymbosi TaxID=61207 RepID=A0A8A3PNN9_9HELO|nr:hypothetical protein DSL72_006643 [Monilinia vaccinii-corymbosi]
MDFYGEGLEVILQFFSRPWFTKFVFLWTNSKQLKEMYERAYAHLCDFAQLLWRNAGAWYALKKMALFVIGFVLFVVGWVVTAIYGPGAERVWEPFLIQGVSTAVMILHILSIVLKPAWAKYLQKICTQANLLICAVCIALILRDWKAKSERGPWVEEPSDIASSFMTLINFVFSVLVSSGL